MDEPTAALNNAEIAELFGIIRQLRDEGVGIVYISHKMDELKEISDRVTVMRDGEYVGTVPTASTSVDTIIGMMVGRSLTETKTEIPDLSRHEVVLEVRNLRRSNAIRDVSFKLRRGEILGFAGLMGAGRTEVARAIFGADPLDGGEIIVKGEPVAIRSPQDAVRLGIGYLSEDRKRFGLATGMDVAANIVMPCLSRFLSMKVFLQARAIRETARSYIARLRIKTPSDAQEVRFLSGGNQQKIVIAKWLAARLRDPVLRRADPWHRRRGEERDLQAPERSCRSGPGHRDDFVRTAGDPTHEPPDRRDVRGPSDGRTPGRGSDSGGYHAAGNAAAQPDGRCAKCDDGGSDRVTTIVEKETRSVMRSAVLSQGTWQKILAFASLIALMVVFSIASENFLQPDNLIGILQATAVNGVLAVAATFVIITGGIDLSVGTLMTFCAVIAGVFLTYLGYAAARRHRRCHRGRRTLRLRLGHPHRQDEDPALHRDPGHDDAAEGPGAGDLGNPADLLQRYARISPRSRRIP